MSYIVNYNNTKKSYCQIIYTIKHKKCSFCFLYCSICENFTTTLFNMIKQYDEMLHKNWDLVTEEQKLRIEVLKEKLNKDDTPGINNRVQIVDDIDG